MADRQWREPPPQLTLNNTNLFFLANAQTTPSSQRVSVSNSAFGSLTWTASENLSWLALSAGSGTAPSPISFSVDKSQVAEGTTVSGQVRIDGTAAGTVNTPQYVGVTFKYSASPLARILLPVTIKSYAGSW